MVSIVGFTAAFAGIKIFPPLLTAPRFARKYLLLLLAAVIALLAYFLLYYFVARFPLLESFLKSAVVVTLILAGAFAIIYLSRNDDRK